MNREKKRAWLILADGTVCEGKSFGAEGTVFGELVCSTGMTGFQEGLTDQSYYGQIIAQTFPLMGNYGINNYDPKTCRVWANGYVVREYCENPSNFRSQMGLNEFLTEQNTVAIYGVDTRSLTRKLRTYGAMNCCVTTEFPADFDAMIKSIKSYKVCALIKKGMEIPTRIFDCETAKRTVVIYDYGVCDDIIESLRSRDCRVVCVAPDADSTTVASYNPDGLVIADGAGDPNEYAEFLPTVTEAMAGNIPVIGIGLGHQLMALATGAKIEKMHYGHRGANQPVKDVALDKVYISSQNHGYVVVTESLDSDKCAVSHINANDGSCEGIKYKGIPSISLQYNPEPSSGPLDTRHIYDEFISMMK